MAQKGKGKSNPVEVVAKLVALLSPLAPVDRGKAIQATLTLLPDGSGEQLDLTAVLGSAASAGAGGSGSGGTPQNEQAYFQTKKPRTKVEELAVAARYRELKHRAVSSAKVEMQAVFKEARYNFDTGNYRRDLENARKRNFFTRESGRDSATLTTYGQNYVDALPDRETLKNLPRQKKAKKARKKGKT